MEDILYPQLTKIPPALRAEPNRGGTMAVRSRTASSRNNHAIFHPTVVIVPQFADQQAAGDERIHARRQASALIEAE